MNPAHTDGYTDAKAEIVDQIRTWANLIPGESEVKNSALRMAAEIEQPGAGQVPITVVLMD